MHSRLENRRPLASGRFLAAALMLFGYSPMLTAPLRAQPSALELLRQLEERYSSLDRYRDRGTIVRTVVASGVARSRQTYRFETARLHDRFLLRIEPVGPENRGIELRVVREAGESFHDRLPGGRRIVPTPSSGLADLLAWGDETQEALIVPLLLAEPEAARLSAGATASGVGETTVELDVPCGERRCDVLVARTFGEAMESRIAVDRDSGWVRSVEIRLLAADDVAAAAMAELGLGRHDPAAADSVHVEVQHLEIDDDPETTLAAAASPPASERRADVSRAPASPAADGATETPDADVVFREEIEVVEMVTRVRVVTWSGEPVTDLGPGDFKVRAGRVEIPVAAVEWVSAQRPPGWDIPPEVRARYGITVAPPGKLVLFFVQADLLAVRAKGHLRLLPDTDRLLATFDRDDWVAVASFDSHLKLRQDFTRSRELVTDALRRAVRTGKAPPPVAGRFPSLGRYLDAREAKRAATAEKGLLRLAEGLAQLPGEKVVIYVGWGLGRFGSSGWSQRPDYERARQALLRANATVFVLDITQADFHTLELGLRGIAADTGGTYEKTFHFQGQATKKLAGTVEGYYLLTLRLPAGLRDGKRLKVTVPEVKGRVLQTPTYAAGQR